MCRPWCFTLTPTNLWMNVATRDVDIFKLSAMTPNDTRHAKKKNSSVQGNWTSGGHARPLDVDGCSLSRILSEEPLLLKPDSRSNDLTGDNRRLDSRGVVAEWSASRLSIAPVWSCVVFYGSQVCRSFLRSPLSFEMFKTFRRPSATEIPVFRSRTSVVAWLWIIVGSVAAFRR